jgi:hypothetical protein
MTEVEIRKSSRQLFRIHLEFLWFNYHSDLFIDDKDWSVVGCMSGEVLKSGFSSYDEAENYCKEMEYDLGE